MSDKNIAKQNISADDIKFMRLVIDKTCRKIDPGWPSMIAWGLIILIGFPVLYFLKIHQFDNWLWRIQWLLVVAGFSISAYFVAQAIMYERKAGIISKLSKKVKLAILTNNKSSYAEEVLEKFNLTNYFETIIGFNDVSEVKPSPEGLEKILEIWKLKSSDAIFIGDMTTDIQAGKAANIKTICVASGLAQKETLQEQNPDILLDKVQDLKLLFNI